jgi:hypothetical protein
MSNVLPPAEYGGWIGGGGSTTGGTSKGGTSTGGGTGGATAEGAVGARVARSGAMGGGVTAHAIMVLRSPRPRHSKCRRETIQLSSFCSSVDLEPVVAQLPMIELHPTHPIAVLLHVQARQRSRKSGMLQRVRALPPLSSPARGWRWLARDP